MTAAHEFRPDSLLPFSTYRTPRKSGDGFARGAPELCASVAHFYFAERFRGADEMMRSEILYLPTPAEARKLAQRTPAPEAWNEQRLAIVKSSLWMQFRAVPNLAADLIAGRIAPGSAGALGHGWEVRRRGNERWRTVVLNTAKQFLDQGRMQLLATGDSDIDNNFLFSSKLSVLLAGNRPSELVVACRAGIDALAEQWAIENRIPVRHLPLRSHPRKKISDDAIATLAAAATHAIIFTRGEDTAVKTLLTSLAQRRTPTRLVQLDKDGRPIKKRRTTAGRA